MRRRPLLLASALLACTAPAQPPTPTPTLEVRATPEAKAPDPTPTPAAGAPASDPAAAATWWCTCYARATAAGPEPLTACRAAEPECRGLERSVRAGKRGMVAGSLTHPCRSVRADHPGDLFGGRAAWQPSKKPGAWLSQGACRLPGPPVVEAPADEEEGFKVLEEERLGALRHGMSAAELIKAVGDPAKKGRVEPWEADAAYHQTWEYPAAGLVIDMVADARKGPQTLGSLTVTAPSMLASLRGIRIGSPRADVEQQYDAVRDREMEEPGGDIIAGSIYGGLIFAFKDGKVAQMFLGAAAE
jgi:hypothetical protein